MADDELGKARGRRSDMHARQNNSDNPQPPPWLVRAEVTIRHGTPVTSESAQLPAAASSTVTDSSGVRMVYRWNTTEPGPTANPPSAPTTPVGSYGFQRGNILFTSTPPPRPATGFYTIPRSGSSGNEDSSFRGRSANVSDSGYNSEQFSPLSYSSLPTRRPSQQYNRRCKSTCSIVLSTAGLEDDARKESVDGKPSNEAGKSPYSDAWRHRPPGHVFSRYKFSTVPEVCEDCAEGTTSSAFTTHFCTRVPEKASGKSHAVSKDAASQTTDIESRGSSSTISRGSKVRRKAANGLQSEEQKRKKKGIRSPTVTEGTTTTGTTVDSEKSDSSAKDDSTKRKSRTVHIDVYCTGSDEELIGSSSSSENETGTPMTVYEGTGVKVVHTPTTGTILPRGFQDETAFLKRATERRCESFRNAPMRMPSLASSKGYESDDVLSSLYPSQFSSYSALRDADSTAWSAASSSTAVPFDDDSVTPTSSKDTFSDIDSLIASKASLTPCDSFEYANSADRERIRRMERIWETSERGRGKTWRSPHIERRHLMQNKKMREYLERHEIGWSSGDSAEDSDESATVGWSFVSGNEDTKLVKKNSAIRRPSEKKIEPIIELAIKGEKPGDDRSDSTTRSDCIPHPYSLRDQIGPFGSKSPSPLPSKVPSRVTSPFTTPQGEKTDHIVKASVFGAVVGAFRKPGHHIGPSKNPSCSCEHCRRYFEEESGGRGRSQSLSEVERRPGQASISKKDILCPTPTYSRH
ncbi:hypothetical protein KM043_016702 [Ampulex compressa]|nr:hypothetical protein KM043_016702 [Ampulex compressa]